MRPLLLLLLLLSHQFTFGWGFYAHRKINEIAIFLLPPHMLSFYKANYSFIAEHAVDPDKRRYVVPAEGPRHYIDLDHYGSYPFQSLPRLWNEAVTKYSEDTLKAYGTGPWYIQTMQQRLTRAFEDNNGPGILKLSADIGHYLADMHVPLHACTNHNGQFTNQLGIHGFWESRIPEQMAETGWDFFIGKAEYISRPLPYIWQRVMESAVAADTVLRSEKLLQSQFPPDKRYAFEERNGKLVRQYSTAYTIAWNDSMNDMVQRRMRLSVYTVASFWYTAWVNAGQPDLNRLLPVSFTASDSASFSQLEAEWIKVGGSKGKICE